MRVFGQHRGLAMEREQSAKQPEKRKNTTENRKSPRPRFPRTLVVRLGRLLYMEYRPSELAQELGVGADTVYRHYIPYGCPHRRDETGHIWIVGTEFAEWVGAARKEGKVPLANGEAYCLKCNAPVTMNGPLTAAPVNAYLELVKGVCPVCGTTVNRARARKSEEGEG
jgi:hypothetical protein